MNGTELRSFSDFQILTEIAYPELSRKFENWLILEFFFIYCKIVKVSQNYQIRMQTWFTSLFFMNGTELRSFSHFQILTWIAYPEISRNLENWQIWSLSSFTVQLWKSVKIIKFECKLDLQVFPLWIEQYWEILLIFKFSPKSHTGTLAEIFKLTNFQVCFHSL